MQRGLFPSTISSLLDRAIDYGYITRKKVDRSEGQVGNPTWVMVRIITAKGKKLLEQL